MKKTFKSTDILGTVLCTKVGNTVTQRLLTPAPSPHFTRVWWNVFLLLYISFLFLDGGTA